MTARRLIAALVSVVALNVCTFGKGEDSMLAVGAAAPEFSLRSHTGQQVELSSLRKTSYVVLIFYPGDETPVCTQQLCEIRDDYSRFKTKGAAVLGINPGSKKSHEKFATKHGFQYPLLIDEKGDVAAAYGAKGLLGPKRTVYVIDKEGRIIFAQRGKPPVSEILAALPEAPTTAGE